MLFNSWFKIKSVIHSNMGWMSELHTACQSSMTSEDNEGFEWYNWRGDPEGKTSSDSILYQLENFGCILIPISAAHFQSSLFYKIKSEYSDNDDVLYGKPRHLFAPGCVTQHANTARVTYLQVKRISGSTVTHVQINGCPSQTGSTASHGNTVLSLRGALCD